MSYTALYRSMRPQSFADVVGQIHIVRTVQNALTHERLSHAYLFCGPRGTGKTSIAKIIAKAVNCVDYPSPEPCNICSNCVTITKGANADVFEIDAASNNGVDEIREIRDKVKYAPTTGRFKVYIIDEVHMLSTGAFNALLKTLEEPPSHVIFILATTEPHKIPATIISRCQRFDFKQISTKEIEDHLAKILTDQGVGYQPEAVSQVAVLAEGGMRDALSLLDQVISYAEDQVTLEDVHAISGTVAHDQLLAMITGIQEEDYGTLTRQVQALLQSGKEPARILEGLLTLYRDLLMYQKVGADHFPSELLISNPAFKEAAGGIPSPQVVDNLFKLSKLQQELRFSNHPDLMLEVGLLGLGEKSQTAPAGNHAANEIAELRQEIASLRKSLKLLEQQPVKEGKVIRQEGPQYKMEFFPEKKADLKLPPKPEAITLPPITESGDLAIEDILLEASHGAKNAILEKWQTLSPTLMPEHKEVIAFLMGGKVEAASDKGFILVYRNKLMCDRLYWDDNRETAHRLTAYLFGRPYPFIPITEAFWLQQRQSFIEQKKQGLAPRLERYQYNPKPQNVVSDLNKAAAQEGYLGQLVDLYGEELVTFHD